MSAARTVSLVFGLCGGVPDRQAIELAAEVARVFRAGMTALMLDDGASETLASLPFAREYVPGATGWRDIGAREIAAGRESSRRRAKQLFDEIASAAGISSAIEFLHGAQRYDIAGAVAPYDIVALAAPAQAGEWMLLPFSALADAAFAGDAAALLVPPRVRRRAGPVAALLDSRDLDALQAAGRMANAANETLVLLAAHVEDAAREAQAFADNAGVPLPRLRIVDIDGASLDAITRTLEAVDERLLVIGRTFLPQPGISALIRLATSRGIPVFVPGKLPLSQTD